MEFIAQLYPPLEDRKPIPAIFLPGTFALTLLPFFTAHRRQTALVILPIILWMCVLAPRYTFGNPSADFYRSSGFITMSLWFVDFAVLRPPSGDKAPVYVGNPAQGDLPWRVEDLQGAWAKLRWAVELMVPSHRGIGWNWQIKNVPGDGKDHLSRWRWIGYQTTKAILAYMASVCMLVVMGLASVLERSEAQAPTFSAVQTFLLDAVIGWAGAIWIYCRLQTFYSSASAVTVALSVYERWQLPPLMGDLRDAWSVRQFWAVYHQTMRQGEMLSAPAVRITRAFGLRKGTVASGLCQLYFAFSVSTLVHQYQMFNVTRRDMGEFAFFMSQPVAITIEGAVMAFWRRYICPRPNHMMSKVERLQGYVWVFVWFSYTLPIYLKGSRDAGIIQDAFFGTAPFDYGVSWLGRYL